MELLEHIAKGTIYAKRGVPIQPGVNSITHALRDRRGDRRMPDLVIPVLRSVEPGGDVAQVIFVDADHRQVTVSSNVEAVIDLIIL